MDRESETVRQARGSFDRILRRQMYTEIIRDDEQRSLLLDMLCGNDYKKILDIGTGTGYLAFALAETYPRALVHGIDIVRAIAEENRPSNLVFQTFDGITYPFEDNTFDLIVSRYAFHHFPNPESSVEQIHRLLIPGGRVLISDPMRAAEDRGEIIDRFMQIKRDGHIRFYAAEELEALFAASGFSVEKQAITHMAFPFAPRKEYAQLYDTLTDRDRCCYGITKENGTVWVRNMEVGNTVFIKI